MVVKVKGFLFFPDDSFLPHARLDPVELDLVGAFSCPSFEHSQTERGEGADRANLFGVFDDLCAGVVFLFHGYSIPQDGRKARDFFTFFETFFVDNSPHFLKKIERLFEFLVPEGWNFNLQSFYFN